MVFAMNLILAAILLAGMTHAVTYLECDCSASERGFHPDVLLALQKAQNETMKGVDERRAKMKIDTTVTQSTIQRYVTDKTGKDWDDCRKNYSWEECVNADEQMRLCSKYPTCPSYCAYDRTTWLNTVNGKSRPACDTVAALRSTDQEIVAGKFKSNAAVRPSPSPVAASIVPNPTRTPPPQQVVAESPAADITNTATPSLTVAVNEGCVAVEHLDGLVLQHSRHLRRSVLCSRGFCATPNHAIIVRGRWTSMKKMCMDEWSCVRAVKMVNNLKVSANTRKIVSDEITITPYDLRFPVVATWFVQMAEDVFHLLSMALTVSVAVAGALAVSSRLS